jgi:hypothetical protein
VWHSSTILIEKINNATSNCGTLPGLSKTNKNYNSKSFYESILDCLPTDFVFDTNHKYLYLNPVAKKRELRVYYQLILNMLHTDRTDNFA